MTEVCEYCGVELDLCPADWPWQEEFWICPKCESKYVHIREEE